MECACACAQARMGVCVWLYLPAFPHACVCGSEQEKKKKDICVHICVRMYVECVRPRFPSMWHLEISYPLRSRL